MNTTRRTRSRLARVAAVLAAALALPAPLAAQEPGRAALLIDTMRANGCILIRDQIAAELGGAGLAQEETSRIIPVLNAAGMILYGLEYDRVMLSEALCASDRQGDADAFSAALAAFELIEPGAFRQDRRTLDLATLLESLDQQEITPEAWIREWVEAYASAHGCVITLEDRATAARAIISWIQEDLSYGSEPELRSDVMTWFMQMITAFLSDPGDGWRSESGRLLRTDC